MVSARINRSVRISVLAGKWKRVYQVRSPRAQACQHVANRVARACRRSIGPPGESEFQSIDRVSPLRGKGLADCVLIAK